LTFPYVFFFCFLCLLKDKQSGSSSNKQARGEGNDSGTKKTSRISEGLESEIKKNKKNCSVM
jgi:hypothetical protein